MQDDPNNSPSAASILLPWLTLAAIIGTFVVNLWSNLAPPDGQTIGEISNTRFAEVQITPANYAFAIWGVIYIGLFAFGYHQLLPAQRHNSAAASGASLADLGLSGAGSLGGLVFVGAVLAVGAGDADDFGIADLGVS